MGARTIFLPRRTISSCMSRRPFAAPGLLVLPILLGDVLEERFLQLLENRGVLVVGVPDADDRRLGLRRRHGKPSHGAAIGMRADEAKWLLMWEATSVSPRSKGTKSTRPRGSCACTRRWCTLAVAAAQA